MINRRSLIAGLGAVCTLPFLPKLAEADYREYFHGQEVFRVSLETPIYKWASDGRTYITDITKCPECKKINGQVVIPDYLKTKSRNSYIFVVEYKNHADFFRLETKDFPILELYPNGRKALVMAGYSERGPNYRKFLKEFLDNLRY